jgi:hypothetical protein
MADYSEFADPIRLRSWQRYVEDDGDLNTLLHEATGHAVAMRDAIAAGDDRVHSGDRALYRRSPEPRSSRGRTQR